MPPRRPPPLPKSLFQSSTSSAAGSAAPAAPGTIHPAYIIDGHSIAVPAVFEQSSTVTSQPALKGSIQIFYGAEIQRDVGDQDSLNSTNPRYLRMYPTVLNLSRTAAPAMMEAGRGGIDFVVPGDAPLSESDWDVVDEAVRAVDDRRSTDGIAAGLESVNLGGGGAAGGTSGKIVVSGLLPPFLSSSSDNLARDESYDLFIGRLNQLSLNSSVSLKALPPAVGAAGLDWVEDRKELERVLRMYLSPAIECFGSHRIIYGSSPGAPTTNGDLRQAVPSDEWYAVLRKVITELGEGQDSVDAIFGSNAAKFYEMV